MQSKEWQKIFLLILASFLIAGIFYFTIFKGLTGRVVSVFEHSYLELTIAGEIPERAADDPLIESLSGAQPLSIQDLLQVIRKAKIDDKILGIILRPLVTEMGWAKAQELRNALLDFKDSGKPIYAFLEAAGNKEYFLASAADSIFGISSGVLFVKGFLSEPFYLKETLEKIGIEADFVAHGKYKTAPHTYTREEMSEAEREVINSILDQFYTSLVSTLSEAREKEEAEVRHLIDQGFLSLKDAYRLGFVDTLMYFNELKEFLKDRYEDTGLRFVSGKVFKEAPYPSLRISAKNTFAVIYGVGTIVIGSESQFGQDGLITSEGMASSIRKAAQDDHIKAIILRLDSPGGSGTASDIIWREVVEARKKKPVIVSISDVAASGGYYISMGADSIVAHPNSFVGSIGVFAGKFSWGKLYEKIGVHSEQISRGKNAGIFSPSQKFTPEQQRIMEHFIMDFYQDFVRKVAESRGMSVEEVDKIARGRVWTGQQAHEIGLVDRLGDFHTAIEMAKTMTGVPLDEPVMLATYPKLKSFWQRVIESSFSVKAIDLFPELKRMPPIFRNIIQALPHFHSGEPLLLYIYNININ